MNPQCRKEFEDWISGEPFCKPIVRYPDNDYISSWPGQYIDSNVEVAWQAWVEALRYALTLAVEESKPDRAASTPTCGKIHPSQAVGRDDGTQQDSTCISAKIASHVQADGWLAHPEQPPFQLEPPIL